MRTETTTRSIFTFSELSDSAKDRARDEFREHNLDYEWWDSTYDDAQRIGIKITSFDLDRSRHARGQFTDDALHTAHACLKEHGEACETFKTSTAFLAERDAIVDSAPKDDNGEFVSEYELDEKLDTREAEYLRSMLEDYSILLQKEYEYLQSDEAIDESIEANDYEFTESGDMI